MIAASTQDDSDHRRWKILALLAAAEMLGMSLWFAASAVAGQLGQRWVLTQSEVAWLTTTVQLGFVSGTAAAALLNLADVVPARLYFALSALLGATVNLLLLAVPVYGAALACRFVTGLALAGVYPPAMKMVATWFRARRGLAIGTVVGALTIGKATPYLVHALPHASANTVIATASAGAAIAAALVLLGYSDGPYLFAPRPFSWALAGSVLCQREWRLATGGYLGHMFELYAFWTWIPAFIGASMIASGRAMTASESGTVSLISFGTIAVGGLGCIWGGLAADRRGREWLVTLAMALSGSCALVIPAAFGRAPLFVAALAWVWGFFVIADSAQFSTLVTESVPTHAVGTALTIQTSVGFLLTTVSIQLVPLLGGALGWRWVFPALALGPMCGIAAIHRLRSAKILSLPT